MVLTGIDFDLVDMRGWILEGRWDALVILWNAGITAAGQHWWFGPLVITLVLIAGRRAWIRLARFVLGAYLRGSADSGRV